MSSDPYKPSFPRDVVGRYFGAKSSAKDAMRLKKENPQLYTQMRDSAEREHGLIGAPGYFDPRRDSLPDPNAQKIFTDEELKARARFSEDRCRELFKRSGQDGNQDNLGNLFRDDTEGYRLAKIAAVSYGVLPAYTVIPPPESKIQPPADTSIAVGDELCRELNLPAGYRVPNHDALQRVIKIASEIRDANAQAQKDEAGDPPAEPVAA